MYVCMYGKYWVENAAARKLYAKRGRRGHKRNLRIHIVLIVIREHFLCMPMIATFTYTYIQVILHDPLRHIFKWRM